MIKASFERNAEQEIICFRLTGHADSGPYGSDIVCAAVSAVAIGAVNGVEVLAGFEPQVKMDAENGGHLELRLPANLTLEQNKTAQIILANLHLSLESIVASYPDYVVIKK
ncbi:hypothetical protein AYR54_03300 [Loigolactobacillus backii]|uniref:ribosomal-processing cysteine protease Prp n=1 Tax=Loigolactobacillus backii TaxID=375175 RepID=UPI0007F1885A|nr:ribosomal-processing cysteine protease Prp [Loigolactobacillus backii]ANK64347.1 hypothetical protein AYR54_03300 [Loigolactobacillus backii]